MTDDQIFRGLQNIGVTGMTYAPVAQPACVETVVAYLPTGPAGSKERWKFSRYWDNPQIWTNPGVQDVMTLIPGQVNAPGNHVAVTTVKAANPTDGQVAAPPDQFEMYNVSRDPAELTNLAGNPDYAAQQQVLTQMLADQRTAKRLQPTTQPWADGSLKQFPPAS